MPVFEEVRTVTANGRLVIPWVIQLALGLEHGGPVRFRVEDGVVTLVAEQRRAPEPSSGEDINDHQRPTDPRTALIAELKMLQAASDRDGGSGMPSL